jgi:hypothetical protein
MPSFGVQSLLDPSKGFKAAGLQGEAFSQAIARIFAFAYAWGLGGNLAPAARAGFDEHVREQLQDVVNISGDNNTRLHVYTPNQPAVCIRLPLFSVQRAEGCHQLACVRLSEEGWWSLIGHLRNLWHGCDPRRWRSRVRLPPGVCQRQA